MVETEREGWVGKGGWVRGRSDAAVSFGLCLRLIKPRASPPVNMDYGGAGTTLRFATETRKGGGRVRSS